MKYKLLQITALCLWIALGVCSNTSANDEEERVKVFSYFPTPQGQYKVLTLTPQTTLPPMCDIGSFYSNKDMANTLFYCENGLEWKPFPGIWSLEGDKMYPTETTLIPDLKIGIGTLTPSADIHLFATNPGLRLEDDDMSLEYIDTDHADFKLDCCNDTGVPNSAKLTLSTKDTGPWESLVTFTSDGGMGIGTEDPEQFVHIKTDGMYIEDPGGSAAFLFKPATGIEVPWLFSVWHDRFRIYAGGDMVSDPILAIRHNGWIGNNTVFPHGHLFVQGRNDSGPFILAASTSTTAEIEYRSGSNWRHRTTVEADKFHIKSKEDSDPDYSKLLTITHTGLMGIATENPDTDLHVVGDALTIEDLPTLPTIGSPEILLGNQDIRYSLGLENDNFKIVKNPGLADEQTVFMLNEQGALGLGSIATAPQAALEINTDLSDNITSLRLTEASLGTDSIWELRAYDFDSQNGFSIYGGYGANLQDRISINPTGEVGINQPLPLVPLHVGDNIIAVTDVCANDGMGNSCILFHLPPSDEKLKKNIKPLKNSLNKLLQLRGVNYQWKDKTQPYAQEGTQMGFIAQDLEDVFPDWIYKYDQEGNKAIKLNNFKAVALEAIKELKQEVDQLIMENQELENQLKKLKSYEESKL